MNTWYYQYLEDERLHYLTEVHPEDGILGEHFFETTQEILDYAEEHKINFKGKIDAELYISEEMEKDFARELIKEINKPPNYTRPNDPDHEDSPKDWLNGALLFTRALSFLLKENEGIVIDVGGDVDLGFDNNGKKINKVIVYNANNQIHILEFDGDEPEGTLTWMEDDDDEETYI